MIEQECIDELAAAIGIKDEVAAITARAMNGELDFEQALKTRVKLLKGLPRARIEEVRRERITFAPGGRALVQTMKTHGAFTSLVSGGFTFFADYIGKRIGFDEAMANILEFDGDVLAGTVADPILGREAKLSRLLTLAAFHDIPLAATLAVGDGANDLDMIKAPGWAWRCTQTRGRRAGRGEDRPWRPDGAAVSAGVWRRGFRAVGRPTTEPSSPGLTRGPSRMSSFDASAGWPGQARP